MLNLPCGERAQAVQTDRWEKLNQVLEANDLFFPRHFTKVELGLFNQYYGYVLKWNSRLHLTTILTPLDFAKLHLLESAFAIQFISLDICKIWDIGSGAGIPGIPFAILRPDLSISLIEANKKKAIFLKEIKFALGLNNIDIINQRFEELPPLTNTACITSRALDEFSSLVPDILTFGCNAAQFLLFGTYKTDDLFRKHIHGHWNLSRFMIPESNQRLVLSLSRST